MSVVLKGLSMITSPDFTWEWIIQHCEYMCGYFRESIEIKRYPEATCLAWIEYIQGLDALVPVLREHPVLGKAVPMMSMNQLRWFPSKESEVNVYCLENHAGYQITSYLRDEEVNQKTVTFDEVANEIYAEVINLRG